MASFWQEMSGLQQVFFAAAVFFSVIFLWQMLAALMGLAGGEDADMAGGHPDADNYDFDHQDSGAMEDGEVQDHPGEGTMHAFKLLSLRSIIAFGLLFCWAGTFYLDAEKGYTPGLAMLFSVVWGIAAMVLVSFVFYQFSKLQETGTMNISSAVGTSGEIYITIEEGKVGKIRVVVDGTVSYINARAKGNKEIEAGKKVKVVRRIDQNSVEVEEC